MSPPVDMTDVPDNFDSRSEWPACIHSIRDQGSCGSCWAFAATEAFSDRWCIDSSEKINVILSPEDMVECDTGNYGCDGGYLDRAWDYFESSGVVTDECLPYASGSGVSPTCATSCANPAAAFQKYKCVGGSRVECNDAYCIKKEISANGPMETGFDVYQDFFNYAGGVYKHVAGGYAGGHAVKMLGWGVEDGVDYWICANSWGSGWGEAGFFRIAAGECNIDASVFACTPDVSNPPAFTF